MNVKGEANKILEGDLIGSVATINVDSESQKATVGKNKVHESAAEEEYRCNDQFPTYPTSPNLPLSPRNGSVPGSSFRRGRRTTPMRVRRKESSSPVQKRDYMQQSDSRDDASQFGESSIYVPAVASLHDGSVMSHYEDVEDVMIHRYLAEKSKFRAADAKNAILHTMLADLKEKLEESNVDAEKKRVVAQIKTIGQDNIVHGLQETIQHHKDELSEKVEENSVQIDVIRSENEKKIAITSEKYEIELSALKSELDQTKSVQQESQRNLKEAKEDISQRDEIIKGAKERNQEKSNELTKLKEEMEALEEELKKLHLVTEKRTKENEEELETLRSAVGNVNEMLNFKDEKGRELSDELKMMSLQYVESIEQLDSKSEQIEELNKDLDALEKKMAQELKKNATISTQLEEMARGFIDVDELLEAESDQNLEFQTTIQTLKESFDMERIENEKLVNDLSNVQNELRIKTDEVLKVQDLGTVLSDQLSTEKSSLGDALSKIASMTETQLKLNVTKDQLTKEQASTKKMTEELANLGECTASLAKDFQATKMTLSEVESKRSLLSKQLAEKSSSHDSINFELKSAKERNEKNEVEHTAAINILTIALANLKVEAAELQKTCDSSKLELDEKRTECDRLSLAHSSLQDEFDALKEDGDEKDTEQTDKIVSLSQELQGLETKYSSLFNSLVETETELKSTQEDLELSNMKLQTKHGEFKALEDELNEKLENQELILKDEQEKVLSISSELAETKNKCESMRVTIVELEERALTSTAAFEDIGNRLAKKEEECIEMTAALNKEQNGPHSQKMKVAKKMIQAEKDRHRAVLQEIDAKDIIIGRIEEQMQELRKELVIMKDELDEEKTSKMTYSGQALRDLHQQLEEERKKLKREKEDLLLLLKSEKGRVKSLTLRLKAMENNSGPEEVIQVSRALKKQFENKEEVQQLNEKNNILEIKVAEKINSEEVLRGQLTRVMTELKKITESMDTMTRYCKGLESEKRVMKNQLVMSKNSKNSKVFFDNLQGRQDSSDDESGSSRDDKSLSEFSVAMVPTPRQTHRELLRQRTNVLESNKERLIEEDIELTVDTEMLYD